MAWDFGWKKKTEVLRMTILSAGHQNARPLPLGLFKILTLFRQTAKTGDGSLLQRQIDQLERDVEPLVWEPAEIHGWKVEVSLYVDNSRLWWLLHASRRNEKAPTSKDVTFLEKILEHLGADATRDMVIGPRSSPAGEPALPFGWWTWFNRMPLYEVQAKGRGKGTLLRVVPLGAPASDGYEHVDLTNKRA